MARNYKGDADRVARHLRWPKAKVQAAFNYAEAFPEEIQQAIEDNTSAGAQSLSRLLPQMETFELNDR